jgi:hypothetical protein
LKDRGEAMTTPDKFTEAGCNECEDEISDGNRLLDEDEKTSVVYERSF